MVKKKVSKAIVNLASLFLCAILILGIAINLGSFKASGNVINAFAAEDSSNSDVKYLSDLDYHSANTEKSRPVIKDAVDTNGTKMQIKIEGSWYTFDKGLFTHTGSTNATATVTVVYNLENLDYNYFTAYVGLNKTATKGDGVRFNVGTSEDGKTWTWIEQSPKAIGPQAEAKFLVVDLSGAKWLQLWANRGANNAHDHAVWADAKLVNSLDSGEAVKPIESYDSQIKAQGNTDFTDPQFELLVLQRELVSRVGQYALKRFLGENEDNKIMLNWLLNDLDSLREFVLGGAPMAGSYYNSLTVLAKLYKSYKNDLNDTTLLNNKFMPDRTFGELCRTMMFSVALTHDKTIGSYLQASRVENQSEPLRRYAIFKYLYQTGRFIATSSYETMSLFGSLRVEEMRFIMSNIIDDESIIWLNDYVQTRINANPKNASGLHTPHSYVRYTDPNYNNPVFYAEENYEYFNNLFAVDGREVYIDGEKVEDNAGKKIGMWDTKYIVPAGEGEEPYEMTISRSKEGEAKLQKVWMNFNNKFKTGSVCGGISKSGTNIRTSRGIPAHVIGQPGHAAILYYSKNAQGQGGWAIDNNVGGWVAATKNERHLLGWGNADWQRNSGGGGTVVFFLIAQEALNDYDNYVKAEEYTFLAKVYQGDLDKQEELYEKALSAQVINLDAWYGLVQTYKAKTNKTSQDFGNLATRIANNLWKHPLPLHCLFNLFKADADKQNSQTYDALSSAVFTSQLKTLESSALTKASANGSSAAKEKAKFILGAADTAVASFSFDGENAGCIVWADSYNGSGFRWKYSLDGKSTWYDGEDFTGDKPPVYKLPAEHLNLISEDKDIYVYIVGASPDNAYRIDVSSKPALPNTLYANDMENRVIGVDNTYEWRYRNGTEDNYTYSEWKSYSNEKPDCTGDKTIEVRIKSTANKPASDARAFQFTADTDTETRKYISVEHLSIEGYSSQSKDAKRPNYAENAIDGRANTYWHTDYAESLRDAEEPAYLTIKLDNPRYLSGLEFVQYQYNASFSIFAKNVKVLVSLDGENWTEAGRRENFEAIDDLKVVHFNECVYGQYVKLVLEDLHETNKNDGIFTTVSMVNLYEDTTKSGTSAGTETPGETETPGGTETPGETEQPKKKSGCFGSIEDVGMTSAFAFAGLAALIAAAKATKRKDS